MDFSELNNDVAMRVVDAPRILVESSVRQAMSKFFRQSTIWRKRYSSVAIVVDQAEYDLRSLNANPICAITDLKTLNQQVPVHPEIESKMNSISPTWRIEKGAQPYRYLCPEDPGIVRLWPTPNMAGDYLDVELALYPGRDTDEIPDWIGEMYFDALVQGACGVLYRLPRRTWTNLKDAAQADQVLNDAALSAQARAMKSNTRAITIARTTGFDEL